MTAQNAVILLDSYTLAVILRASLGGVAQLARAGVSYAPGRGFDSLLRHS